jgi:hypothetical protein
MIKKVLYKGFDALDVSFKGALPHQTLEHLLEVKEEAQNQDEPILTTIGSVEGHVHPTGAQGGYAFMFTTGDIGEIWTFKNNPSTIEWNIGVSVRAATLVSYGYQGVKARIYETLNDMGAIYGEESIRRVDFAIDFLMEGFELYPKQLITPARTKKTTYYEEKADPYALRIVSTSRIVDSVTAGKTPNQQVIIYNKRKEAIEKKKSFWFQVWGIDNKDRSKEVWRVEIRAHKNCLRNKFNIRTFLELENSIGDVFLHIASEIRYIDSNQSDSNVSRAKLHPLWIRLQNHLKTVFKKWRTGIVPNQIQMCIKMEKIKIHEDQIAGNTISLAAVMGISEEEFIEYGAELAADIVANAIDYDRESTIKKFHKTKDRLRFVTSPPRPEA